MKPRKGTSRVVIFRISGAESPALMAAAPPSRCTSTVRPAVSRISSSPRRCRRTAVIKAGRRGSFAPVKRPPPAIVPGTPPAVSFKHDAVRELPSVGDGDLGEADQPREIVEGEEVVDRVIAEKRRLAGDLGEHREESAH